MTISEFREKLWRGFFKSMFVMLLGALIMFFFTACSPEAYGIGEVPLAILIVVGLIVFLVFFIRTAHILWKLWNPEKYKPKSRWAIE